MSPRCHLLIAATIRFSGYMAIVLASAETTNHGLDGCLGDASRVGDLRHGVTRRAANVAYCLVALSSQLVESLGCVAHLSG